MMDASLAKGLTKRFLEEYHEQALKKVKQFRPSIAAFSSRKSWSRFVDNFSCSRNTWAVHAAEYGTQRKPNLGFLTLARTDFNALKNWEESMLRFIRWDVSFHHEQGIDRDLPLAISHHAIQRIFQRSTFGRDTKFSNAFAFFQKQFASIPFWYHLFFALTAHRQITASNAEPLKLPIAAQDGLFLCEFSLKENNLPHCDIRTFVGSHQLSTEQEKIRNIEEGITKIYSELPLIYLMGSPFQTVRTPQTDSIGAEGVEATFMLEAILIRQKPEILRVMEFIEKDNKKNRALYDLIMSNFEFLVSLTTDTDHIVNNLVTAEPNAWLKKIHHHWQKSKIDLL